MNFIEEGEKRFTEFIQEIAKNEKPDIDRFLQTAKKLLQETGKGYIVIPKELTKHFTDTLYIFDEGEL